MTDKFMSLDSILEDIKNEHIVSVHSIKTNNTDAQTLTFYPLAKGQSVYIIMTGVGLEEAKQTPPAFIVEIRGRIFDKIKRIFVR